MPAGIRRALQPDPNVFGGEVQMLRSRRPPIRKKRRSATAAGDGCPSPAVGRLQGCSDGVEVPVGGSDAGQLMHQALDEDVVTGSAVERVDTVTAHQHVITGSAEDGVVAGAADQNVGTIAAVENETRAIASDP